MSKSVSVSVRICIALGNHSKEVFNPRFNLTGIRDSVIASVVDWYFLGEASGLSFIRNVMVWTRNFRLVFLD